MSWRRLAPGELDHETLWLGVSVGTAALGAAWFALGMPRPECPLHAFTGVPCPGCGTTRAVQALLAGDWNAALLLNPLACALLAAVMIFNLYALVVLVGRLPRWRPPGILPPLLRHCALAALALNWLWLIWREVR